LKTRARRVSAASARRRLGVLALCAALAACAGACRGGTYYLGTDCLGTGTGKALQDAIDSRQTVVLCRRAVITLEDTVTLRQGLTLMTDGMPTDPAEMATILLGPKLPEQITVALRGSGSDIHIMAVFFDGNRRVLGARDHQIPLELGSGDRYIVQGCVFSDSPGWTHLHLQERCGSSTIVDNVVESAVRPHDNTGHWTDGLSIACSNTLIEGNRITDVSSNGIVYFGGPGSTIRNNVITETTTSAFSGINVGDAIVPDNTGVVVQGNHIVATSPRYFTNTGIAAGLHVLGKTTTVTGVSFLDNTFEGMARYGLAVDGCLDCTVTGNDVTGWHPLPVLAGCPASANYVAARTALHASGDLQPGFVDAKIDNCGGQAEVLGDVYRTYAGDTPFPEYLAFEVKVYSQRLEQKQDAAALLAAEWDAIAARAKAICPAGTPADLQSVWLRLTAAQFGGSLAPAAADARVRADLMAAPAGTPCAGP
jgi:hypothetical protein